MMVPNKRNNKNITVHLPQYRQWCRDILLPPLETKSVKIDRRLIVDVTRDWLGTPYLHQSSTKNQGTDCLGLIRGVYRDLYGREPERPPAYTPDWNERFAKEEPLLSAAQRHLVPCRGQEFKLGRVLIFRIVPGGPAKHCGIVTRFEGDMGLNNTQHLHHTVSTPAHFIHAYAGRAVIESWLSRWWRERIVGVFDYPGAD
ncbi:MAG: NlpC/P60 family protein [Pseudomonadota bacterium]